MAGGSMVALRGWSRHERGHRADVVVVRADAYDERLASLILDGLRRTFWTPMTIGASMSILLALVLDALILYAGRWVTPWDQRGRGAI